VFVLYPPSWLVVININFFRENLPVSLTLCCLFFLLIFLSGFVSTAETVFSTVNIIRLRNFMEEKRKGAKKAVYISEKYDYTLTTLLIVNILMKISITIITLYILINLFDSYLWAGIVTAIILTTLILLFTEIIPRARGQINPEKFALRYAGLLYFIMQVFYPFTFLYVRLKKRIMSKRDLTDTPKVTEEELESIIDAMETEGVIEENDAEMIQNTISLSERTVYDIMTPRVDVIAVEASTDIETIKEMFIEYQFSRVPVYREDKDNIIGILSEKDFFTALIKNEEIDIEKMVSEPYYVSKTTKVNELIQEMQKLQKHFAIVVDDYGGTSGIVTMEDALEEIVGEIYDEYDDVEDIGLVKISDNYYSVSPEMDLEEFFETLELGDVPDTQFSSVGGFVYGLCDGMPYDGKTVNYQFTVELDENTKREYVLEFIIKKVEKRRIKALELKIAENDIEE
jgi:putative hemolysin